MVTVDSRRSRARRSWSLVIGILVCSLAGAGAAQDPEQQWVLTDDQVLPGGPPGAWNEVIHHPSIVKVGRTYRLYYAGQGPLGVGLATSTDGLSWTQHPSNPVLSSETTPGLRSDYVNTPVVRRDGGLYRLWYRVAYADGSNRIAIAHATSPDGVQWTRHGVVLDSDPSCAGSAVGPASVLLEQGLFHLYYWKTCFPNSEVHHATSGDGFTWQELGVAIPRGFQGEIDSVATNGGWVVRHGNVYRMWYGGHDSSGEIRILAASSEDGVLWQPLPGVAIDAGAATVIRVNNEYRLYGPYPKDGPNANQGFALFTWAVHGGANP